MAVAIINNGFRGGSLGSLLYKSHLPWRWPTLYCELFLPFPNCTRNNCEHTCPARCFSVLGTSSGLRQVVLIQLPYLDIRLKGLALPSYFIQLMLIRALRALQMVFDR